MRAMGEGERKAKDGGPGETKAWGAPRRGEREPHPGLAPPLASTELAFPSCGLPAGDLQPRVAQSQPRCSPRGEVSPAGRVQIPAPRSRALSLHLLPRMESPTASGGHADMPPANGPAQNKPRKRWPQFLFTLVGAEAQGGVRGRETQPEERSELVVCSFRLLTPPEAPGRGRGIEKVSQRNEKGLRGAQPGRWDPLEGRGPRAWRHSPKADPI